MSYSRRIPWDLRISSVKARIAAKGVDIWAVGASYARASDGRCTHLFIIQYGLICGPDVKVARVIAGGATGRGGRGHGALCDWTESDHICGT